MKMVGVRDANANGGDVTNGVRWEIIVSKKMASKGDVFGFLREKNEIVG